MMSIKRLMENGLEFILDIWIYWKQKLLESKGLEMPQTWANVLKPEFKKRSQCCSPRSIRLTYTMLATLVQLMGEKGLDYCVKLNEQVRQYTKSGTTPARMVGSGEAMLGITFLHHESV